ncbi:MAG: HAD hydrolase-like protein [Luteolibacter sp.]
MTVVANEQAQLMLCLFDIDGTLIDTRGAGMASLQAACRDIFGDEGPPLDLAGSTDLGLLKNLADHYCFDAADADFTNRFFETYHRHLERHLHAEDYPGTLIDGATILIDALVTTGQAALGLLTGNTARGAHLKVRRHGIDHHFPFGAYGCDHADRNLLGPIALERAAHHHGRHFDLATTWIIGDTPRDIACAKAIGARCIAVATGSFTADQLAAHAPDHVCESLAEAVGHFTS